VLGFLSSLTLYLLYLADVIKFNSDLDESFWGAGTAFVVAVLVAVIVTQFTPPKPEQELHGLVYGLEGGAATVVGERVWWRNPVLLGSIAVAIAIFLYIPVW
jgi:SSS family solute:Na+ symporter